MLIELTHWFACESPYLFICSHFVVFRPTWNWFLSPNTAAFINAGLTRLGQGERLQFDSSDGRVVRASAPGTVDLGLIISQVKPVTLILVFAASLLGAQH